MLIDSLFGQCKPSDYTLRHYISWDAEAVRNWLFQVRDWFFVLYTSSAIFIKLFVAYIDLRFFRFLTIFVRKGDNGDDDWVTLRTHVQVLLTIIAHLCSCCEFNYSFPDSHPSVGCRSQFQRRYLHMAGYTSFCNES